MKLPHILWISRFHNKKMTDFVYLAAKWNWFRILSFKLNLSHNITNMIGLSICFLMTRPPSPIRNGLYHNISHWKWRWTQIYVTYPSLFPSSSQVSDSRIGHLASDTWLAMMLFSKPLIFCNVEPVDIPSKYVEKLYNGIETFFGKGLNITVFGKAK